MVRQPRLADQGVSLTLREGFVGTAFFLIRAIRGEMRSSEQPNFQYYRPNIEI
jgi:hypothetical protein